ncbi:MAG TPA: hypothetical protein VFT32_11135 [Candidatus Eisenbacteria bacterium]|nr:hypothetical protein [Candidatus Eisenbacteria bacterium]
MNGWECRVEPSLDAIDPREWDSILAEGDHQASARFLRVCRDAAIEDARYRYVRFYHGGRLAATAVLTAMTVSLDLLAPRAVRAVARGARALHPRFLRMPIVLCGLPVSFGASCLRVAPGADGGRVVALLGGAMEEFAEAAGAGLCCVKELTDSERAYADSLLDHGFVRAPSLPGSSLRIEWRDFTAYAAAMRSGYRRQLRASLSARCDKGLRLRVVDDWSGDVGRIHRLYEEVMDRAEYQLERLPIAFFERLRVEFGPDARVLFLERDGDLEAAAVLLYGPRALTFLLAGIDYARNEKDRAYQNLVAEVVAEAIRRGAARVELGQTSYALKARLGAVTEPRWLYLRHRRAFRHELLRRGAPLLFPDTSVPARHVFAAARRAPVPPVAAATPPAPAAHP